MKCFALSLLISSVVIGAASSFQLQPPAAIISRYYSMSSSSKSWKQTSLYAANKSNIQFITNKRCPFAQKAWIALESSEVGYDMREISLYGVGGKPDWFWKYNPQGTVPVVVVTDDNGAEQVFADSELILDAVGDGSICNSDNRNTILQMTSGLSDEERANVDQWRSIISKQINPVGKSAALGGSLPKLRSLLKELNNNVVGPYLVGDKMTVADCAAFPFFWRIDTEFGIGGEGEENLRMWLDKCMDTPSIKQTIPAQGWWWWW